MATDTRGRDRPRNSVSPFSSGFGGRANMLGPASLTAGLSLVSVDTAQHHALDAWRHVCRRGARRGLRSTRVLRSDPKPTLIPIFGHRCIVADDTQWILSIVGTDAIIYAESCHFPNTPFTATAETWKRENGSWKDEAAGPRPQGHAHREECLHQVRFAAHRPHVPAAIGRQVYPRRFVIYVADSVSRSERSRILAAVAATR